MGALRLHIIMRAQRKAHGLKFLNFSGDSSIFSRPNSFLYAEGSLMSRKILLALSMMIVPVSYAKSVVVFSGGFGSCFVAGDTSEMVASSQFEALVGSLAKATGEEVVEVRSCYAFGSDEIYVTSEALDINSESMTRADFYRVVQNTVKHVAGGSSAQDVKLFVWGQSHGGWTVMDFARTVSNVTIELLMTVDPISVENCGPGVFSGGVITGDAQGCAEAPTDMLDSGRAIAGRARQWSNWYQTQFPHIHSGPVSAASENIFKSYEDDFWHFAGAHGLIQTDPTVWSEITQRVVRAAKR